MATPIKMFCMLFSCFGEKLSACTSDQKVGLGQMVREDALSQTQIVAFALIENGLR